MSPLLIAPGLGLSQCPLTLTHPLEAGGQRLEWRPVEGGWRGGRQKAAGGEAGGRRLEGRP
eukprot:324601-Chlamydomonas_euryale.AAC.1